MSTIELKTQIHEYVERLQDENLVQAIHTILDTHIAKEDDRVIGYELDGTPQYASEMGAVYDRRVAAAERGEYITLEELEEKSKASDIETVNVEYGVSLEEIKKRQTINKMTFEELEKMFEGEEWEQTLGELIESID